MLEYVSPSTEVMNGTPLREYASRVNEKLNTSNPLLSILFGSSRDNGEAGITSGSDTSLERFLLVLRAFLSFFALSFLTAAGFLPESTLESPEATSVFFSTASARRSDSSEVIVSYS